MTFFGNFSNFEDGFIVTNKDKMIFSDMKGNMVEGNLKGKGLDEFLSSFDVSGKDIGSYPLDDNSSAIVIGGVNHSGQEGNLLATMMEKVGKIPDNAVISSLLGISYGNYSFGNNFDSNTFSGSKGGPNTTTGSSKIWMTVIAAVIGSSILAGLIFATGMFDNISSIDDMKQDLSVNLKESSNINHSEPKNTEVANEYKPIDFNLDLIEESNCPIGNISLDTNEVLQSKSTSELVKDGNNLYSLGLYEQALLRYQMALKKSPNDIPALNGIGTVMEINGNYHESISCFNSTLSMQPDNINALNGIGNALLGLAVYEKALEFYERSLALSHDNINALNGIGNVRMGQNQYEQALEFYERSLALSHDNDNANVGMGRALTSIGKYSDASTYFDRILEKNPYHLNAALGKSIVFIKLGQYDKAKYLLKQIQTVYPENVEIHFLLNKINSSG